WQATLDGLVKKNRIDLKMLLSPAIIEAKDQDWKIIFSDDLKAHYQNISENENKQIILETLQEVTSDVKIELAVEISEAKIDEEKNLNKPELQWIKDVRQMGKDLNIPIEMEE
ncbi:MAG: hypothetical protein GX326_07845, partial [Clostridiaceae bacterium]|nr:hypothetical protein [Clostridiaceae bacterium]